MDNRDFLKEEYLTLRKEVECAMAELASLERNCVIATAAVYTWLVTVTPKYPMLEYRLLRFAWFIPVLLSVFGALRSFSVGEHLYRLSTYIQLIEIEVFEPNEYAKGWEHFHTETTKSKVRTKITFLFWLFLIIITVAVAVCVPSSSPNQALQKDAPKIVCPELER